jgi:hypothetical protein
MGSLSAESGGPSLKLIEGCATKTKHLGRI